MAQQQYDNTVKGFVALTSVIILGAIGAIIATALLVLGTANIQNSQTDEYSAKARGLANTCAELALLNIKNNGLLSENNSFNIASGTCDFSTTINADETVTITSLGNFKDIIRKVKIQISTTSPNIEVSSWQEVADF